MTLKCYYRDGIDLVTRYKHDNKKKVTSLTNSIHVDHEKYKE
jgi:hypothetical protein